MAEIENHFHQFNVFFISLIQINQLDGVTHLNASNRQHYRSNRCRSKSGVCPQCYLNNVSEALFALAKKKTISEFSF